MAEFKQNECFCVFQAVLQTNGQLELEVRPLFLVPDTNGFIDHLGGLKKLLQCGTYIIVIPLIGKRKRPEDNIRQSPLQFGEMKN